MVSLEAVAEATGRQVVIPGGSDDVLLSFSVHMVSKEMLVIKSKYIVDEKKYNVNAQQFFNYYESNGWKIGRNAMKSWQAAVQNWNTREKANNKAAGTMWANNSTDADTAGYDDLF